MLFPFKALVLDVFDSIFLKYNLPYNRAYFLKIIIYSLPRCIIVTDDRRLKLLPAFAQNKAIVMPNVPFLAKYPLKTKTNELVVCLFGTLVRDRGSEFALNMINANPMIELVCAGWICDKYSEKLLSHPRVSYLGIMSQVESNNYLSKYGDYLLMIYPTNNLNNKYASPNKIYDAIHTKTPVIINSSIYVSSFVASTNIGVVVNDSRYIDYQELCSEIYCKRESFNSVFTESLKKKYSWNNYEDYYLHAMPK